MISCRVPFSGSQPVPERCQSFSFSSLFPVQQTTSGIDDCVKSFFCGLATNLLKNVRKQQRKIVFFLSLQPMIPPKRFDIFPLTRGCSEGPAQKV